MKRSDRRRRSSSAGDIDDESFVEPNVCVRILVRFRKVFLVAGIVSLCLSLMLISHRFRPMSAKVHGGASIHNAQKNFARSTDSTERANVPRQHLDTWSVGDASERVRKSGRPVAAEEQSDSAPSHSRDSVPSGSYSSSLAEADDRPSSPVHHQGQASVARPDSTQRQQGQTGLRSSNHAKKTNSTVGSSRWRKGGGSAGPAVLEDPSHGLSGALFQITSTPAIPSLAGVRLSTNVTELQSLLVAAVRELHTTHRQLMLAASHVARLRNVLDVEKTHREHLLRDWVTKGKEQNCVKTCHAMNLGLSLQDTFTASARHIARAFNQHIYDSFTNSTREALAKGKPLPDPPLPVTPRKPPPLIRISELFGVTTDWYVAQNLTRAFLAARDSSEADRSARISFRRDKDPAVSTGPNPWRRRQAAQPAGQEEDAVTMMMYCTAATEGLRRGFGVYGWGAGREVATCVKEAARRNGLGAPHRAEIGGQNSSLLQPAVAPPQSQMSSPLPVGSQVQASSAGGLPASLRLGYEQEGPAAAEFALLALLQPAHSASNPLRTAWAAHGLDWHDLVRPTVRVKDEKSGSLAYTRADREVAKEQLLSVLGGWTARGGGEPLLQLGYGDGDSEGMKPVLPQVALTHRLVGGLTQLAAISQRLEDGLATAAQARAIGMDPLDLSAHWASARETGPLGKYSTCRVARDPCMLHATARACVEDELCGWCPQVRGAQAGTARLPVVDPSDPEQPSSGLCMGRWEAYRPEKDGGVLIPSCAAPLWVTRHSVPSLRAEDGLRGPVGKLHFSEAKVHLQAISASNCSVVVTRRSPIMLGISGNSQMAYHFYTETVPGWFLNLKRLEGFSTLSVHVYVWSGSSTEFVPMLYPFTDSCPRLSDDLPALPPGSHICYSMAGAGGAAAHKSKGDEQPAQESSRSWPWSSEELFGRPTPPLALWDSLTGDTLPWPSLNTDWDAILGDPMVAVRRGMRLGLHGQRAVLQRVLSQPEHTLAPVLSPTATDKSDAGIALAQATARRWLDIMSKDADKNFETYVSTVLGVDWAHPWPAHNRRVAALAVAVTRKEGRPVDGPASPLAPADSIHVFRPLVTLISRRNKRFLLNEEEVVRLALALGARVQIAALEDLSLYAQVRLFRQSAVVVGIHGSGLINSMYMRPGSVLLQIVPPKLMGASTFFKPPAEMHGVKYLEHTVRLPALEDGMKGPLIRSTNSSAFHFHFLDSSYPPLPVHAGKQGEKDSKRGQLKEGSECCGQSVYFSFWINCDVRVDLASFGKVLHEGLEYYRSQSKVHGEDGVLGQGKGSGKGKKGDTDAHAV